MKLKRLMKNMTIMHYLFLLLPEIKAGEKDGEAYFFRTKRRKFDS